MRAHARPLLHEYGLSLWKRTTTPPHCYDYSIHIHAHSCQLQARRCLSPDGGELHNSLICLWPPKECSKASPIPSGRHQKERERERCAICSKMLSAPPFLSIPKFHPPFYLHPPPSPQSPPYDGKGYARKNLRHWIC